jgi:hypothetical protein
MNFPRKKLLRYCAAMSFFLLPFLFASKTAIAQQSTAGATDECRECPPPADIAKRGVMDLIFDNGTSLENCTSIKRTIIRRYDKDIQALDVHYQKDGKCVDTILEINHVTKISYGGLGLGGNPIEAPVFPAREFYRNTGDIESSPNFYLLTPFIGYGGKDTTIRKIGFSDVYYGIELIIAPFGRMLGERLALGLAGSALFEGGRFRIPLGANLRWTFLGTSHVEQQNGMIPSPCKFSFSGDRSDTTLPAEYVEVPSDKKNDPNVYYIHEKQLIKDTFRPFIYLEGGIILNGSFDGAGKDPSVNNSEYGQYYAGIGGGLPLFNWLVVSLGYRYMRLNLRTPCAVCPADIFVQNTNVSHSVLFKVGLNIP